MALVNFYATMPRTFAAEGRIQLDTANWELVHCCTVPVEKINSHPLNAQRPYEFMRRALGIILGASGDLSTDRHLFIPVDYNAERMPIQTADLYFHVSDEGKRRIVSHWTGILAQQ